MAFNSLEFALFLPVVLLFYYAIVQRETWRDLFLLVVSYIFYMSWYWQYAGLIAVSTIVDYVIGRKLVAEENPATRKLLLIISIVVNLGILAIFKYFNFFIESSQQILGALGLDLPPIYLQVALPVGISFYTFQTLSYTIDIYRKSLDCEKSFVKFAVFVSFFPQLVAGPIVRAKTFLPQLNRPISITQKDVNRGMTLIFIGLFKKIVIADLLAYLAVDAIFDNPSAFSSWDLLIGLYAYAFQIYCDFSGYSDIAIGVALLMGFKLPLNFNRPYLAQNPSDFWRRWHITLSAWLRDYLYVSLGGNRGSKLFTDRNLMLTMLLGGLWHGAAWNFIIWGAYHGMLLIIMRRVTVERTVNASMVVKIFVQFHLVVFGWLLFRVTDMSDFSEYVAGLLSISGGSQLSSIVYAVLLLGFCMHLLPKVKLAGLSEKYFDTLPIFFRAGVFSGAIFLLIGLSVNAPVFIYFQF